MSRVIVLTNVDRSLAALLIVILTAAELPRLAAASPPFVAAFDRFGRHHEIDRDSRRPDSADGIELYCVPPDRMTNCLAPKGGPRLNGAADRLDGDWIRQFLTSPQATKPGTTMPDVLAGIAAEERSHAVAALAAFLQTQHEQFPGDQGRRIRSAAPRILGQRRTPAVGASCITASVVSPVMNRTRPTIRSRRKPSPLDELLVQLEPDGTGGDGARRGDKRAVNSVPHADLVEEVHTPFTNAFLAESGANTGEQSHAESEVDADGGGSPVGVVAPRPERSGLVPFNGRCETRRRRAGGCSPSFVVPPVMRQRMSNRNRRRRLPNCRRIATTAVGGAPQTDFPTMPWTRLKSRRFARRWRRPNAAQQRRCSFQC